MKSRCAPIFAALGGSTQVVSARGATGPGGDGVKKVGGEIAQGPSQTKPWSSGTWPKSRNGAPAAKSGMPVVWDRLSMPPGQPTSPEFIIIPASVPAPAIDWPTERVPMRCARGLAGLAPAQCGVFS